MGDTEAELEKGAGCPGLASGKSYIDQVMVVATIERKKSPSRRLGTPYEGRVRQNSAYTPGHADSAIDTMRED